MIEPSLLRDSIVLGLCFAACIAVGAGVAYQLAKARWYRQGRIDGAASQRKRDEFAKPLRSYNHDAA